MSKLEEKFLEQYSFSTLRDVALTAMAENDFIIWDSSISKFKNIKQPRFGTDFAEITRDAVQDFTGAAWQTYVTLNFSVTGPDILNKFRFNTNFLWRHDSISNGARFRLLVDAVQIGDVIQIEPKDSGVDQRIDGTLLRYVSDLSIGAHTALVQVQPANSSRITTVHQATLETWRVS